MNGENLEALIKMGKHSRNGFLRKSIESAKKGKVVIQNSILREKLGLPPRKQKNGKNYEYASE